MTDQPKSKKTTLICPLTRRFESIFVCALNCPDRCKLYADSITYEMLSEYIESYPDYEIKGELMPTKKKITDTDTKRVKQYWILDENRQVVEVSEDEIVNNPKEYLSQEIWDKPPNQYEIVITLKRKKKS
jgi:hypothetical protein